MQRRKASAVDPDIQRTCGVYNDVEPRRLRWDAEREYGFGEAVIELQRLAKSNPKLAPLVFFLKWYHRSLSVIPFGRQDTRREVLAASTMVEKYTDELFPPKEVILKRRKQWRTEWTATQRRAVKIILQEHKNA